mmetsp:Transcript_127710/g.331046  ORF Transcript_127710/g.331046 Transcript_127710/m.331046 type:complete len:202 (-) Transcript_127710:145-750(-)
MPNDLCEGLSRREDVFAASCSLPAESLLLRATGGDATSESPLGFARGLLSGRGRGSGMTLLWPAGCPEVCVSPSNCRFAGRKELTARSVSRFVNGGGDAGDCERRPARCGKAASASSWLMTESRECRPSSAAGGDNARVPLAAGCGSSCLLDKRAKSVLSPALPKKAGLKFTSAGKRNNQAKSERLMVAGGWCLQPPRPSK